jgi:hypothetical protein
MVYGRLPDDAEASLQEDVLDRLLSQGDEKADRLVRAFLQEKAERGIDELENLLIKLFRYPSEDERQSPPLPMLEFLRARQDMPNWFKEGGGWARVTKGQKLYDQHRLTALLILGCASLPQCYANSEIAGTLIMSGRLAAQVRLRLGETANFLETVMKAGALQENGIGLQWIRKVRLIHAVMRALIAEDPARHEQRPRSGQASDALLRINWKERTDRMPIDQLEMVFVLLTFSLIVVDGWRSLGISPSEEECNDYMFTWAAIGHLLGVDRALLPHCCTMPAARKLRRQVRVLQARNGRSKPAVEAGRLLSAALLVLLRDRVVSEAPIPALLRWILPSLPHSLIRRLVGAQTAGDLWVDPAPLLPRIVHWFLITVGAFGRRSELGSSLGSKIQQEFCASAPHFRPR